MRLCCGFSVKCYNMIMRKVTEKKSARTTKQFRVIVEQDLDGYFIASVPALPGCYTQGKTLEEVTKRIKEAILLCIEVAGTDPQYHSRIKNFAYEPAFVGLETIEI